MTETQVRPKPRIDHPEELERMVRQIVDRIDPVAIYLFGSRARGDAHEDSDYDLMIVVRDETEIDRGFQERLWQLTREARIGATPFLTRDRNFAWRRSELGTLEYEVETDGLQLYPRRGRVFPPTRTGRRRMNVEVVEEWLHRVRKDLTAARKCCEGDDAVPDQAAYHVQQAAEKLVKGALVAHLVRPRKGHKIEEFSPLLPKKFPLRQRFVVLEQFSKYAWAHRYPLYPGQQPVAEPSTADVSLWIEQVAELKGDFERWLAERGAEKN